MRMCQEHSFLMGLGSPRAPHTQGPPFCTATIPATQTLLGFHLLLPGQGGRGRERANGFLHAGLSGKGGVPLLTDPDTVIV